MGGKAAPTQDAAAGGAAQEGVSNQGIHQGSEQATIVTDSPFQGSGCLCRVSVRLCYRFPN